MNIKVKCAAILLAFGFLAATASAESYRVTLGASKIGSAELRGGDYKIEVGGPKVILTELKSGKSIELNGKVETADKKFSTTEVHSRTVNGTSEISEIRIGGSKTKIAFD